MLIVRCPLIPRKFCVNLFGVVLAKDTSWIDAEIVNHEKIHLAQMRETLLSDSISCMCWNGLLGF